MLTIKDLDHKDYKEAIRFAMTGMNFEDYANSTFMAYQLAKVYFYSEVEQSTRITAAYDDNRLAGYLMAHMKDEELIRMSALRKISLWFLKRIAVLLRGKTIQLYQNINSRMLCDAEKTQTYDGELLFFAVNPEGRGQGIGSALLREFESEYPHTNVYLFTDSGCSYEFYDKRGFVRKDSKVISVGSGQDAYDFECFLYEKLLP